MKLRNMTSQHFSWIIIREITREIKVMLKDLVKAWLHALNLKSSFHLVAAMVK